MNGAGFGLDFEKSRGGREGGRELGHGIGSRDHRTLYSLATVVTGRSNRYLPFIFLGPTVPGMACVLTTMPDIFYMQSEELKVAKESEANVKRMKREMERQEIVRRKVREINSCTVGKTRRILNSKYAHKLSMLVCVH